LFSTIFLGDVRICSNLPSVKNIGIIGTRLENGILKELRAKKNDYMARVKVGNKRYLAGYTPLYNNQREIVGILGIAFSEKEIFETKYGF